MIGAVRSSYYSIVPASSCSLSGPLLYRSPVVGFLDRGYPCFRNFNSTVPVDFVRVKSYVNSFLDPTCVPVRISSNKLDLIPDRIVAGLVGVFRIGGGLGAGESYIPVVFFDPLLHRSPCFPDVDFAALTGNKIAFLDTSVYREPDGRLTTSVYRKPTHTDQYLAYDSHHPRSVKRGIVKSLYDRAKRLVTKPSVIAGEKKHLSSVLVSNGYPSSFVQKIAKARTTPRREPVAEFKSTAVLPYVQAVSESLRRCLEQQGIRTVLKSDTTLRSHLVRPKDTVNPAKQDGVVYRIPCECGKVYIGETGRSFLSGRWENNHLLFYSFLFKRPHLSISNNAYWSVSKNIAALFARSTCAIKYLNTCLVYVPPRGFGEGARAPFPNSGW